MTTETSRNRKARSSSGGIARTSRSAKRISPWAHAHDGRRRSTASPKVDLPLPDSPARPKISPGWIASETLSSAGSSRPQ